MHVNVVEGKIKIDITNINDELNDWIEQIGKTTSEICDDLDCDCIRLKMSDNGQIQILS
jgi:hypothetical protein